MDTCWKPGTDCEYIVQYRVNLGCVQYQTCLVYYITGACSLVPKPLKMPASDRKSIGYTESTLGFFLDGFKDTKHLWLC